jgi:outer membrane immunogenic protein
MTQDDTKRSTINSKSALKNALSCHSLGYLRIKELHETHEGIRIMFRHMIITAASAVMLAAAANAADVYRSPAVGGYVPYAGVNWSGLYVGVNAGGAWNSTHSDDFVDPTGGFGGGQIGYNWQGVWHPNLVLGIEADFQGAGVSDTHIFGDKSELNWFGTVRGRFGYAFGPALLYGTGGFAYGNIRNKITGPGGLSISETQTGWVVGGGVEYKLAPAWSIKSEYQFLSLDAGDPNGAGALGLGFGDRTEFTPSVLA